METGKSTVSYIAHLARIKLEAGELEKLSRQFQDILGFIDKLKQANIENISPTSHILAVSNVVRQDKRGVSLPLEQTLSNAPQKEGAFFVVPKVIE